MKGLQVPRSESYSPILEAWNMLFRHYSFPPPEDLSPGRSFFAWSKISLPYLAQIPHWVPQPSSLHRALNVLMPSATAFLMWPSVTARQLQMYIADSMVRRGGDRPLSSLERKTGGAPAVDPAGAPRSSVLTAIEDFRAALDDHLAVLVDAIGLEGGDSFRLVVGLHRHPGGDGVADENRSAEL